VYDKRGEIGRREEKKEKQLDDEKRKNKGEEGVRGMELNSARQ